MAEELLQPFQRSCNIESLFSILLNPMKLASTYSLAIWYISQPFGHHMLWVVNGVAGIRSWENHEHKIWAMENASSKVETTWHEELPAFELSTIFKAIRKSLSTKSNSDSCDNSEASTFIGNYLMAIWQLWLFEMKTTLSLKPFVIFYNIEGFSVKFIKSLFYISFL